MITGKAYDVLKWVAQILLPALGTLYFTLAGLWGFPNPDEVVGTVMAVDLFLGLILGLSQSQYLKNEVGQGVLHVEKDDGELGMRMAIDETPEALANKTEVRFKVNRASWK